MVEYNGGDYATYLCNVFPDDADFQGAAKGWATEEVQHGQALARWAKLADDSFDFDRSFQRFRDGFKISTDAADSIRGRSEEHTSELQSLMRSSYAVFCLKKK